MRQGKIMGSGRGRWSCLILCLTVVFLLLCSTSPAFPLRSLQPGSPVPDFDLPRLGGGQSNVLGAKRQVAVIVFWSTDTESKQERALQLLRTLQAAGERYASHGVSVRSVNVDRNNRESLKQLIEQEGITLPVLLDENEEVYGAYGIFILPTVAIVDRDGTLSTAMGYSHNIGESIIGEIEILLGLKTREQLENELSPEETVEAPDNVKKAARRVSLGRSLAENRLLSMAQSEFEQAVELDPHNVEAHAELGSLYVRQKDYDKALEELGKAVELDPESVAAHVSLGVLHRRKGESEKAIAELERVLELEPAHAAASYELGRVLEDMGKDEQALERYRQALSTIFKDELVAR